MMKLTDVRRARVAWILAALGALLVRYAGPYLGAAYLALLFNKTGALSTESVPGWAAFLYQNGSALVWIVCAAAIASISASIRRADPEVAIHRSSLRNVVLGFPAGVAAGAAGTGIFLALDMARVFGNPSAAWGLSVFAQAAWVAAAAWLAVFAWGSRLRGSAARALIPALLLAALVYPAGSGAMGAVGAALFALTLSFASRRAGWVIPAAAGWCAAQEAVRLLSGAGGMLHVSETWLTGGAYPMRGLFWIACFAVCCGFLGRNLLMRHPSKGARRLGQVSRRQ